MATSPTQRTMRELRNQGRRCAIVERFNSFVGPHGVRQDLFGIIDVIALDPVRGVVGVQSCGQNFAAHERKLLEERADECIDWLSTPGTVLELWGWRKLKLKRGGKAERWTPRVREFTLADFGLPERGEPMEIFCGRSDLVPHTWHHWWRLPDGTYGNEDDGGVLVKCPGLPARSEQLVL